MRKLILLILASALLCSAAQAETLVVWFSCTGNTEALLANGPVTLPASGYGGFEKVRPLGTRLPSHDEYTVTKPGDVMLFAGSSIVLFHGSNSWEYTRLGWMEETQSLRDILSGNENEITMSLE